MGRDDGMAETTGWGPVPLPLRKKGMNLEHLERCIDQCDPEWLWLDQIAMPEVYEDMDVEEKARLNGCVLILLTICGAIHTRADKLMVVDSTLLRLNTIRCIDGAVFFVGFSMTRLWPLTESRSAKRVLLKTEDFDMIIDYLARTINNSRHR